MACLCDAWRKRTAMRAVATRCVRAAGSFRSSSSAPARQVLALRGVSLAFERDEITCILGPNGGASVGRVVGVVAGNNTRAAGKTTLLSVLLGLARASSGVVRFLGEPSCDNLRRCEKRERDKCVLAHAMRAVKLASVRK